MTTQELFEFIFGDIDWLKKPLKEKKIGSFDNLFNAIITSRKLVIDEDNALFIGAMSYVISSDIEDIITYDLPDEVWNSLVERLLEYLRIVKSGMIENDRKKLFIASMDIIALLNETLLVACIRYESIQKDKKAN